MNIKNTKKIKRTFGGPRLGVKLILAALILTPDPAVYADSKNNNAMSPARAEQPIRRSDIHQDPAWQKAEYKRRLGSIAEAVVAYLDLVKRYPEDVRLRIVLAESLSALNQQEDALLHANTAKSLAPRDPEVVSLRGSILERLNRLEEALRSYRELMVLDPDSRRPLFRMAVVLRKLKNYEEARVLLNRIMKTWPRRPEAFYESAVCAVEEHDWTRAQKDLAVAERLGFTEIDPVLRIKINIKRRN